MRDDDGPEREAFESRCTLFGLEPGDFGALFSAQGVTYRLVGFDLAGRRFPFVGAALRDGSERLKFRELVVLPQIVGHRRRFAAFVVIPGGRA